MLIYLQLIETAAEKTKFETLYEKHRNLLFYIAKKMLNNQQDAEDAVHQAFLQAAKNIKKISDPDCPETKSYLVIITENICIDLLRKKKRYTVLPPEEYETLIPAPTETGDRLADCIAKLNPQHRHVLWLRYYLGYTLKESAKILNISYETAKKWDQRAKQKLKEQLESKGELL